MRTMQIFNKISLLRPDKINFLTNEKFKHSLKLYINDYIVYLNFNNHKKGECFIYYQNNYYFSLTDQLNIIFEYLYLIINKNNSENHYNAI